MSTSRRIIEQLVSQGRLPIEHAEAAAKHLEVYPSKSTWLSFFDKALLIIGALALVLSLVFFIAYNWQNLGKLGKFALVEGALVITIALYVALSFRRRFHFICQLLLLVASIITGSLLALFGQVYQTGADTWQLFFAWAVLISPWVIIARFPALWLLWLGLVNTSLMLYLDVIDLSLFEDSYQSTVQIIIFALVNFIALNLWLVLVDNKRAISNTHHFHHFHHFHHPNHSHQTIAHPQTSLHWSSYVVALVSTIASTLVALTAVFENSEVWVMLLSLSLWAGWCAFIYWRFYQRDTDLLMLTYLCFSSIVVIISLVNRFLLVSSWEAGGFLLLALLLIGMSSAAVVWLRKVADESRRDSESTASSGGTDYE